MDWGINHNDALGRRVNDRDRLGINNKIRLGINNKHGLGLNKNGLTDKVNNRNGVNQFGTLKEPTIIKSEIYTVVGTSKMTK